MGQTPAALGWGKPLALLCYLAIRGAVRRDEIVDLLWRDVDEAKARNAFRQALHRLRTALGDDLIPHDRDRLRLEGSARLTIDVTDFEKFVNAGRFDEAVDVYSGDFLEGSELGEVAFDHWCEQERTRLRTRFRQVLRDSVLEASSTGRWTDAIAYAKRLQTLAPFEPDAAKLAATTLLSAGRRLEALDLLRQFAERTERELGVSPHRDVQGLLSRLSREGVASAQASSSSGARGETNSLAFVGREAELSQLLLLWQTLGEDAGAVVLLEGESGIGKTRLIKEFVASVRSLGGVLTVSGRERGAGAQLPYGVFAEALRPLVRAPGIAGASAHLLAEAARLLPELRDNLDLPHVGDVGDEGARLRFFEGVAAFIDAAAYEQRILIVLEDLQHVPPSSLDLLSYLVARLAGAQVMFVLTLQSGDAPQPVVSRLRALAQSGDSAHGRNRRIMLEPLSVDSCVDALKNVSASSGIPASSVERIARMCAGNPLRLFHAARSLSAGEPPAQSPIPMRDVFADRLQRLSSTQRRVFLVLAMLGRPATMKLAAAAAHVSEDSCRDAFLALEQSGFVDVVDDGARAANDVASDIALDVAGSAGRAFLSGWIADALERDPQAQHAELSRLHASAGNATQTFIHARRAAFAFLKDGATEEAAQQFTLARTFSTSQAQLAEMEGALDALGSGRRRLAKGVESPRRRPTAEQPLNEERAATARRVDAPGSPREPVWQRLFPNWRILFGAALATLTVSAAILRMRSTNSAGTASRTDTLVVSYGSENPTSARRLVIGSLSDGFALGPRVDRTASDPGWVDSLSKSWTSALPSPRGTRVAMTRRSPQGADLYVVSRDRRDSVVLLSAQGGVTSLGWSPDGGWLLASHSQSATRGGFDIGLIAFRMDARSIDGRSVLPIDTVHGHAVVEAAWSPDGAHIAWVARVGVEHQTEVFSCLADGSGVRNLSRSPAEDYHIAWSPDGDLLAFTSTRDGNAELYAADFVENRLWRLTQNVAHDDHATFSADGRTLAFESTRQGFSGVYVMPALGGQARLVGGAVPTEVSGWRVRRSPFIDHVLVDAGDVAVGDAEALRLRAFDDFGDSVPARHVEWRLLDTELLRFAGVDVDTTSTTRTVVGLRPGLARVVATVGRWRSDTVFVRVGSIQVSLLQDDFANNLERWRVLGEPRPIQAGKAQSRSLVLRAGRDWESGLLSTRLVPMAPGLTVDATFNAPWSSAPDVLTESSLALVAPEDYAAIDSTAPQFLRLASVSWKGAAGRFIYAVGKEIFTEPVTGSQSSRFTMHVEDDGTVSFFVDDSRRWRSTLRITAPQSGTRAQLWISGRATKDLVRVTSVSVALSARDRALRRD